MEHSNLTVFGATLQLLKVIYDILRTDANKVELRQLKLALAMLAPIVEFSLENVAGVGVINGSFALKGVRLHFSGIDHLLIRKLEVTLLA